MFNVWMDDLSQRISYGARGRVYAGHVHVMQAMCMHVAAIVQALVVRQASESRHDAHDAHICCPLLTPSLHASAHDYIHAHT